MKSKKDKPKPPPRKRTPADDKKNQRRTQELGEQIAAALNEVGAKEGWD